MQVHSVFCNLFHFAASIPHTWLQFGGGMLAHAFPLWPLSCGSNSRRRKDKKKRILILMSDTGGGHRASAEALKAGFDELYGGRYQVGSKVAWWEGMQDLACGMSCIVENVGRMAASPCKDFIHTVIQGHPFFPLLSLLPPACFPTTLLAASIFS
jgi:hypothetical protein